MHAMVTYFYQVVNKKYCCYDSLSHRKNYTIVITDAVIIDLMIRYH